MTLTTYEMDGLLTPEDVAFRYVVWLACTQCGEYTQFDIEHKQADVCVHCGSNKLDLRSTVSDRSYNPLAKKKKRKK